MALKKKKTTKAEKEVVVTFDLPAEAVKEGKEVRIVGDFNNWNTKDKKYVLKKNKDGSFSIELSLGKGKEYQFRYLIDGSRWENDWEADKYVESPTNPSDKNSVVVV